MRLTALIFAVFLCAAEAEAGADPAQGARPCAFEDVARPSVLLDGERLAEVRRELEAPSWRRELYDTGVRANADLWVSREIVIPPRSGHYHHFFCTDGTLLEIPGDQRFTTREYRCPACGKVYAGKRYTGGRRHFEHRWLYGACRDLALTGALEQDARYTNKAAEILLKYAEAYPGPHTSPREGGIMFQSLDEAVMMIPLAQAYDLVRAAGALDENQCRSIEHGLFWPSAEGLVAMGVGGNWGSWHLCAVGVIGVATRHQRFTDYGVRQFKRQIREQLGTDGLWPESVHTYHFYPLRAFIHLAEACAHAGIDLWGWRADNGNGLEDMFTAPLRYMYPDTRLPAINDGWFDTFLPGTQYEIAYYRYRKPELAWALERCHARLPRNQLKEEGEGYAYVEPWALLHGVDLPESPEPPPLKPHDFDHLGIAVLRNDPWTAGPPIMLTFDYGPYLGHGQLDKLGVTLYGLNRLLAADYGTPGYGSEIMPYYHGSTSHNVVVVDRGDQAKTGTRALTLFRREPGDDSEFACALARPQAQADEVYPGVQWKRSVAVGAGSAAIFDSLRSETAREFDWLFHCEGERLDLPGEANLLPIEAEAGYPYFSSVQAYACADTATTAVWRLDGGAELWLYIEHGPEAVVFTARCPAETGARTVPAIIVRSRSLRADFSALLMPRGGSGTEAPVEGMALSSLLQRYRDSFPGE